MLTKTKRFEVRPKASRNAILMSIGCVIFTIGGFLMIFSGENILAGLLAVVFFGGGGLYAIPKMLHRKVAMVLTPQGIEQHYPQGSTFIPWSNIEGVGIVTIFSNKLVGIRLRSYDSYLNDMSPELAEFITKSLPYMKLLARATSLLDAPTTVTLWSKLDGTDPAETLKSFGKVGNFAEVLMWARENYGYDLTLSWVELDRSAKKFVALLEEYRSSVNE